MKEEICVYFIGTAGSGKSTLTHFFKTWMNQRGLDSITVNLDPGVANLPYEPDVDVRDWISWREVMKTHNLGPNGAQIACADMLALNAEDIKEAIHSFKTEYVLIDTPGQLELFVFREAGKYIVQFFNPERTMIAYLLDPVIAKTPSGFTSQLLLSITTSFRMGKPQVNVLSKADVLTKTEIEKIEGWSKNSEELFDALTHEEASIYREINEGIIRLIENFEMHSKIVPTSVKEFMGIEDLYAITQLQFAGGEDLLSD